MDLGIYLSSSLNFYNHINATVNKVLKVLAFTKHNTKRFTFINCLCIFYIILVRIILEYVIVILHLCLAKNNLRLERVQNRFLSYAVHINRPFAPQLFIHSIQLKYTFALISLFWRQPQVHLIHSLRLLGCT